MQGLQHSAPARRTRRVLILGGGFGGVHAALRLDKLLAPRRSGGNAGRTGELLSVYPAMLPEVAAGELELSAIINPVAVFRLRGLLCFSCNLLLGHAQDDPELLKGAAQYLERFIWTIWRV